jgi:hypothetical protein
MNARTGALSYLTDVTKELKSFAPGAIVTNFLHLGQGTTVSTPAGGPGFAVAGPGLSPQSPPIEIKKLPENRGVANAGVSL